MAKDPSFFAGEYRAVSYAYGVTSDVQPLIVDSPSGATSGATQTLVLASGVVALQDGTYISPLATNAPVVVGTGANADTVTPSAVSINTPTVYQSASLTATTFSHSHGTGDRVSSGTVGLQEAINAASAAGGGIVIVDAEWYKAGGTAGILAAATVPSGVTVTDNHLGGTGIYPILTNVTTLTNAQVLGMQVTPVQLLPAGGANTAIIIDQVILESVPRSQRRVYFQVRILLRIPPPLSVPHAVGNVSLDLLRFTNLVDKLLNILVRGEVLALFLEIAGQVGTDERTDESCETQCK